MMHIDLDLIKKYDRPGPRYTSYPTAPHFHEGFTSDDYIKEVEDTNRQGDLPGLSLYYHIPFCDTLCYFCGCNMAVTRDRNRIARYLDHLISEIDLLKPYLNAERKVEQLHWGGGTPTHLSPQEISRLINYIRKAFPFADEPETGCEIDPRELTKEHLFALRDGGFNRLSMGVQDFTPEVQKAVNRIQSFELTERVVAWIRDLGFESLNLDLIYGLPYQSLSSFEHTVDSIIKMNPERIAVFNFAHVPWMKKHQELINPDTLPKPEEKLEILKMTIEKLTSAGYVFIGMDHFAKPDDELAVALSEKRLYRNFQGYSTHAGADVYAFGITSISQIGRIYAQNLKTEKEYAAALNRKELPVLKGYLLNDDDILRRYVIMKLMCDFSLDFASVDKKFSIRFEDYFSWGLKKLNEMIEDNLVTIENRRLNITEMGRLLIRNVAMCFDGYLERNQDTARYSRTV
jgi:oxygen-independent coproporphyrinogen-3 oxidase